MQRRKSVERQREGSFCLTEFISLVEGGRPNRGERVSQRIASRKFQCSRLKVTFQRGHKLQLG